MDTKKVIEKLNEIQRHEWKGVAQYAQFSFMVTGMWREVFRPLFKDGAEESLKHAQAIGDKIVALGGVPTIQRGDVEQSSDTMEMLEISRRFEEKAVQLYNEALKLGSDDAPLRVLLENLILEEQEGAEHLEKLLREQQTVAAGKTKAAG